MCLSLLWQRMWLLLLVDSAVAAVSAGSTVVVAVVAVSEAVAVVDVAAVAVSFSVCGSPFPSLQHIPL